MQQPFVSFYVWRQTSETPMATYTTAFLHEAVATIAASASLFLHTNNADAHRRVQQDTTGNRT